MSDLAAVDSLTVDVITDAARSALLRRLDADNPRHALLAYLATCQWCAASAKAPA